MTPGILGFISWVVDLEVFGPRFWVPGSWVLGPGVLGLRSWVLGPQVQRNLLKEVTGNRVSNIVQETSI